MTENSDMTIEARVQLRAWGSGTGLVTYHAQPDFDTFQAPMP